MFYSLSKKYLLSLTAIILLGGGFITPLLLFAATLENGMPAAYVLGQPDFVTSTGGGTSSTTISLPRGTAFDSVNNRLFVSGGHSYGRILVYSTLAHENGQAAVNVLGAPDFITVPNSSNINAFQMNAPAGLAYDEERGFLFAVDQLHHRVLVFDVNTIVDGEDAIYVLGQPDFISGSYGAFITANNFNYPEDLAFDSDNNILYVSDLMNSRVLVFDVNTIVNGEDAIHVLGQPDFSTGFVNNAGPVSASGLYYPSGLSLNQEDQILYLSDSNNSRVLAYDVNSITNGENAVNVLGQENMFSNTASVSQDGLSIPSGSFFQENTGFLYVIDREVHRLMVFDTSGGVTDGMDASHVLGQPDFVTSGRNWGGPLISNGKGGFTIGAGQTGFSWGAGSDHQYPSLENNILYVPDRNNNRVLIFDLSTPAEEPTSRGYTPPPTCTATITPNTITKGDSATLSWDIQWPTDRRNSYYMKVPKEGLYSSKVQSINISPEHTTTYRLATFNLFGANFCEATVIVLDDQGVEVTKAESNLSASASSNPFMRAILSFFSSLFGR